jgi:glycerol kinase
VLSGGRCHVTDHTNAAVTGLTHADGATWHTGVLDMFGIPATMLPAIVPSAHVVGEATALPGRLPLLARAGDQQCSLIGQACVRPGRAKITFGTGGMLDVCTGAAAPAAARRLDRGTFPIVAWSTPAAIVWGLEAIMLSAGSNVDWLREDLGLVDHPAASHDLAQTVSGPEGVVYVPALMGLGTPEWDFGARGTLLGVSRGVKAGHIARAVLDGVAHRGVDLIEAAEADSGLTIDAVRIDGGMSANPTFVQALADLSGRAVEVSPVVEATTRGAGFLAGLAAGIWSSADDAETLWRPATVVEPLAGGRTGERAQWAEAVRRSTRWIPELSALDF